MRHLIFRCVLSLCLLLTVMLSTAHAAPQAYLTMSGEIAGDYTGSVRERAHSDSIALTAVKFSKSDGTTPNALTLWLPAGGDGVHFASALQKGDTLTLTVRFVDEVNGRQTHFHTLRFSNAFVTHYDLTMASDPADAAKNVPLTAEVTLHFVAVTVTSETHQREAVLSDVAL